MDIYLIYITTKDKAEAQAIGRFLVEGRLVACVNIVDKVTSLYIWQGDLQEDRECVMIAKTTAARVPEVIEAVKARHSYTCPCIVSVAVTQGHDDYLAWIAAQVA